MAEPETCLNIDLSLFITSRPSNEVILVASIPKTKFLTSNESLEAAILNVLIEKSKCSSSILGQTVHIFFLQK